MLYHDKEYKFMPYVASYIQHNEQHEQHVPNKDELKVYEQLGHITDLTFTDAEYTDDQRQRLAEVRDYPISEYQTVYDYVIENKIKQGTTLAERKNAEMLLMALADLDMQRETDKTNNEVALAELSELLLGGF